MVAKKKGAGGNLNRSEVITVRLDPKLRYLAELAALKQRRTLSSYIEWAIQDSLNRVYLREGTGYNGDEGTTFFDETDRLWDVDAPDRFAKLALHYPELLNYDEQKKWKLIRENGNLWKGRMIFGKWTWVVEEGDLIIERLRKYWDEFCAVAEGTMDSSVLPTWAKEDQEEEQSTPPPPPPPFPEEVPF